MEEAAMPFLDLKSTLGVDSVDLARFETILLRLVVAAFLGAFLGYRTWRRFMPHALPPSRETAQAQTLIAVAGALMVAVIGNSTARAFGLVGLGAFIRFRSGIKDPRDAAVMFVMIGIGMACGLGAVPMAVVATMFASLVLAVFDASWRARLRVTRVAIVLEDPGQALARVQAAFPGGRVIELPNAHPDPGKLVMEVVLGETVDAAVILQMLADKQVPGVRAVSLEEGKSGSQ
jgi:uncharacterized membrane protein YhiD involved in acid resistance